MPAIAYIQKRLSASTLEIIDRANEIIEEYTSEGYVLTLRQLYYQFVARALLPNTQRDYKRLGGIISDGRLTGMIDWAAMEDRTRSLEQSAHWDSPEDIVNTCAKQFKVDKWENQEYRPEVWVEKEALAGVVGPVAKSLDIPFFCCRGYTSQSAMWVAGMRLRAHVGQGQRPFVIHLGDHDPSGIDMTRDISDRLALFMGGTKLERIALNMDQVDKYSPPPNPAKVTDSRAAGYIAEFGPDSWELDALEPRVLDALIRRTVEDVRDDDEWNEACAREEDYREEIARIADNWNEANRLMDEAKL